MTTHDLVEEYFVGALQGDEKETFERHLTTCDACKERLRELVRSSEEQIKAVLAIIQDPETASLSPRGSLEILSGMAIVQVDMEGRCTFVNDHAVRLCGRSREELANSLFWDTLLPTDRNEVEKTFKSATTAKGGMTLSGLVCRHLVNGRIRHMLTNWMPIRDDQGDVAGMHIIMIDVSEWAEKESLLKQEKHFFQGMVEGGEVAIGRLDLDGRILYVNDYARRLWGKSLEEALRGSFIDRVVAEDRAQAQQAFREVIETGTPGDVLLRFDTPAGPRYCINALAPIKNALGAAEMLQLTIMDITPIVVSQRPTLGLDHEYSSIAEVTESAIIRVNRKGNCTFSNDYASTLFDTSAEDLFESVFGDSLLAPDKHTVRERLRRTFETGEPVRGLLTTHLLKGEQRILLTKWEPIRDNRRKIEEVQLTIVDATEHIYAERRRAQSERLEALTKMARGLAHEVNNTLAAIMLWGNVALTKNENAEVRGALEKALEAAQSGAETMKRIQRFAEPGDPGRHDLLNLNEIAADCVLFTRPHWKDQSEAEDIHITVEEDLDETVVARGNAAELREAVVNLITNAIEAMPNGGTLTLKTFRRGESACLTVSDTGGGIRREDIANIFAPFYTTRPEGGRGLGLSVAENIVKLHGGEVQVESQNGKGSAFTIVLPRADSKPN